MQIALKAHPPFSFSSVIHSHGWSQLAPLTYVAAEDRLNFPMMLNTGRVIPLDLTGSSEGLQAGSPARISSVELGELRAKLTWMFGLDLDLQPFHALAEKEPKLAKVKAKAQGRVLRSPTVFEDIVKTILTTNTLWAATRRMVQNLVDQFGEPLPGHVEIKAFPTPARLAAGSESALREQTRLGYRAPYILELARRVDSGDLDPESFKNSPLPTAELRRQLLGIKGVGGYAAANLLMILGRYDYIPVDTWAVKVVSHEWFNDQPIGAREIEQAFEKWGQWKGLVYFFYEWSDLQ